MIVIFNWTVLQGKYELSKTVEYGRASETSVSVLLKNQEFVLKNETSIFGHLFREILDSCGHAFSTRSLREVIYSCVFSIHVRTRPKRC